ncbi:MAG: sensor histidine kinase, partial [Deltaproteobacteria bacterium]|nr:sensor histidine kinase [Deltaproteobacteria bacterium]
LGKHQSELTPKSSDYEKIKKEFASLLFGEDVVRGFEYVLLKKDGSLVDIEINVALLQDNKGTLTGSVGSVRDITKRRKTQNKIIEYQNKLKSLASQLTLVEEHDRRHFADYLHDQIGQKLFISKLKLEVLKKSLSSSDHTRAISEIYEIILQVIKDARSLTLNISPPILYQLGLRAALEWLTEQTSEQYGIMVTFEDDGQEKDLEDDTKVLLFRAVSELLSNVAKHAQTHNAKVSMQRDNDNIRICIEDDGVGFTPLSKTSPSNSTGGFGLFSIGERVDHLGGQFKIESRPGHGTKAIILAPLSVE